MMPALSLVRIRSIFLTRNSVAQNPMRPSASVCNVSFQYLYRDASNYKLHGEAVFTNISRLPIAEVERRIHASLENGEFFIAWQVRIEERFFDTLHEDDHPWHEFARVEATAEPAFDPESDHKRDITEFLADMEQIHQSGWDETNVRADVARLMEKQKAELKEVLEKGEEILTGDGDERSQS